MRKFALSGFRLSTSLVLVLSFVVLVGCEGTGGPSVGYYDYQEYMKKPHYRVFVSTGSGTDGAAVWCWRWGYHSAQAAVNGGLKRCEEYRLETHPFLTEGVYLYAIGDIKVWDMTDKQLKKAIEVYQNNPDATNADLSSRKKQSPTK